MRIAVDLRCLQETWRTGVGEYTWRTCQALAQLPEVTLVGYTNAAHRVILPPGAGKVFTQVHQGRIPNRLRNVLYTLKLGAAIDTELRCALGAFDALWLPVPMFASFSGEIPVVLTVHDLSFIYYPEFFRRRGSWWYFPLMRRLLSKGLPEQGKVVAVSHYTAADVAVQFPQLAVRTVVAQPGIGPEFTAPPSAAERARVRLRYQLPEEYLLSLGTIEPRKNYTLLLKVYAELVACEPGYPYDLVIAGTWGWRTRAFQRQLAALPCRSRVHVLGYVAAEDKPALYAGASIFLYPSFYEGYGMPVLEAMAMGVPVIASANSSLPEVVGNAGLLVNAYRPEAWLAALRSLSYDQPTRALLGQRARSLTHQRTWQVTARVYHEVFTALIS